MEDKRDKHESYGLVGFSRVTGSPGPLFGSSIQHHNFVRMRVMRAGRTRDLNRYWYSGRENIVEVDLSPTQFADLLTSMNVGEGVPCTLRYVGGNRMDPCPAVDQRQEFVDEFDADVRRVMTSAAKLAEEAAVLLKQPKVNKADLTRLNALLAKLMQDIQSNLPFVHSQFNEAMDKTVTEAKGEVEAFVQNKIVSLGIESLRKQIGGSDDMIDVAPDRHQIADAT
jgi:hypothetical protein